MSRLVVLVLALTLPALSWAADSDTQEISRYVLTDAGLAKYTRAMDNLRPVAAEVASCDEENADSIAAMAARIDGKPAAKAAIKSAGLTSHEFVVFMFATIQAGMAAWATDQPGGKLPPGVSQANVNFYKANRAKIEGIPPLQDACDDDAEDEDR
jgi:hypothetical protein